MSHGRPLIVKLTMCALTKSAKSELNDFSKLTILGFWLYSSTPFIPSTPAPKTDSELQLGLVLNNYGVFRQFTNHQPRLASPTLTVETELLPLKPPLGLCQLSAPSGSARSYRIARLHSATQRPTQTCSTCSLQHTCACAYGPRWCGGGTLCFQSAAMTFS